MAIHLGRPLPDASRDRPGRQRGNAPRRHRCRRTAPTWSCSWWGLPCRFRCRSRGALLPHPFTLTPLNGAVCSLWHFPWGRPRRTLSGTIFPWSPDFPPQSFLWSGHPAIWRGRTLLRSSFAGQAQIKSNHYCANSVIAVTAPSKDKVSASATPSQREGRKWRWKAVRVAARSSVS